MLEQDIARLGLADEPGRVVGEQEAFSHQAFRLGWGRTRT